MNCEQIAGRLSAYVDHQLPAWEKELVANHTAHCLGCQADVARLLSVKLALRAQNRPSLPESVRQSILDQTIERSAHRGFSRIWWLPAFVAAAAAAGWLTLQHLSASPRSANVQQAQAHPQAPPQPMIAWHGTVPRTDSEQTQ